MRKPVCPCKDCTNRTLKCKTDGTCPNGYAEREEERKKYSELVMGNRMKDAEMKVVEKNRSVKKESRTQTIWSAKRYLKDRS